jgi:hypothetical protein
LLRCAKKRRNFLTSTLEQPIHLAEQLGILRSLHTCDHSLSDLCGRHVSKITTVTHTYDSDFFGEERAKK